MSITPDEFVRKLKTQHEKRNDYEVAKRELIKKYHPVAPSDNAHEDILKKMGYDVTALKQEGTKVARDLEVAHNKFLAFVKDNAVVDIGDLVFFPPDTPTNPNLFNVVPPASIFVGDTSFWGYNQALGELNFKSEEKGSGWGLEAVGYIDQLATLIFRFTPPRSGNIRIEPFVQYRGAFAISADDRAYTSTWSELELEISSKFYQHYLEEGPSRLLIDQERRNSSDADYVAGTANLSFTTTVSANDPALIYINVRHRNRAHSKFARAEMDFKTGASRYLKVPSIRITYF
jgi:hypothetical protein